MSSSFVECERNIKLIDTLLDSIGFVLHPDKSIFVPARSIEYLGFVYDSQSMTISLTQRKNASIKHFCHEVLQEEFMIIKNIARLIGKFTSSFPAVCFGSLHYRLYERHKIFALKFAIGKFDKKIKLSQAGKKDILW